jgi:hypothetical protein
MNGVEGRGFARRSEVEWNLGSGLLLRPFKKEGVGGFQDSYLGLQAFGRTDSTLAPGWLALSSPLSS